MRVLFAAKCPFREKDSFSLFRPTGSNASNLALLTTSSKTPVRFVMLVHEGQVIQKAGQAPEAEMKRERRPVEDGVVIVDCGPCLRRFGLVKIARLFPPHLWCVKDICGIICVVLTWLLVLYAEYVVMFIMLIPSPNPAYGLANAILFNFLAFMAVASHSKAMLSDPGAIPKGNATRENIMNLGLKEGQVVFKCPKCISIKPERAHHCSVCQRCIRKMDHHCPWVNNCIGENNQKYFVLFTLYICLVSIHAIYMCVQHFITCISKDWKGCSGVSPPATTIFLIFLVFEGLLFGIFTAIMFGSQLTAICSDETGIEQLKKEHGSWERKSYWFSIKSVFGHPFSWRWFNPFSKPNFVYFESRLCSV